jgi:translation initiation factor 4E
MWEDPEHLQGGSFLIRLPRARICKLWERLLLNLIGEQFPQDVTGAVVTCRTNVGLLYLWHSTATAEKLRMKIAKTLVKVLKLPNKTVIKYSALADLMNIGLGHPGIGAMEYLVHGNRVILCPKEVNPAQPYVN